MDEMYQEGPRVAKSEAQLIDIVSRMFRGAQIVPPITSQTTVRKDRNTKPDDSKPKPPPPTLKIGPTCSRILDETLRKSAILWLTRNGAWETRGLLLGQKPKRGPVWDRYPTIDLKFGKASFVIFQWLVNGNDELLHESLKKVPLETGDGIVLYLTRNNLPLFRYKVQSPLCWLLEPNHRYLEMREEVPSFSDLIQNQAWILESLITRIVRSWVNLEQSKSSIKDCDTMLKIGDFQRKVMRQFLTDCDAANRRDLSVIFTEAASRVLRLREGRYPTHRFWIESLDIKNAPLSKQQSSFEAAGAFLKELETIHRWVKEYALIAHWEEEYRIAQMMLANWSIMTTRPSSIKDALTGFERAASLFEEMSKLD